LVGVASATVIALLLVALQVGMAVQARRIARERDRAEQEAAKATAINAFLQYTLVSAIPLSGMDRDVTLLEALEFAVERIDESFGEQPEIEAAVRSNIGGAYVHLRRYEEAESLLRRALEIQQRIWGEGHRETASSLVEMGFLFLQQGKWEEAEPFIRDGVRLARKLGEQGQVLLGNAMINLAQLAVHRGDLDEAESIYRDLLAMYQKRDSDSGVAWARHSLAGLLGEKGDYEEAEALYRDALDGVRKIHGNEYPMVATCLLDLGRMIARLNAPTEVQQRDGDCETALPLFEEAIRIREASMELNSADYLLYSYGQCLTALARYEEAEQQLVLAYSLVRDTRGTEDKATLRYVEYVEALADLYEAWGKPEKAAEYRTMLTKEESE
jgi:tetratricopeptide (TPR) repeat protein